MGKLIKLITVLAVLFFIYWTIKQFFRRRKLESQGIEMPKETFRPITLLAMVMVVMYGAYMVFYLFT